jgi:TonB-dependent SusC/RagA subfamily outer membrane receptor
MKKVFIQSIVLSVFAFSFTGTLSGQEKIIHGKVTTFNSIPVVKASITVKSTKKVAFSDSLGKFTVLCFPKDKLKVSARGFSSRNVKTNEQTKLVLVNLELKPDPKSRELAIGYGHVLESEKLDAISSLNEQDMDYSYYNNIFDLIRGKFPGVEIRGNEIIIRGGTTVHGSDAALLILDGREVDAGTLQSIPTTDIASVNVLKGPAASIYGVNGANGVILVETKSGKSQ